MNTSNKIRHKFPCNIQTIKCLEAQNYTTDEIKNEPMLFGADWSFAIMEGGPITQSIMKELHSAICFDNKVQGCIHDGYNFIIDTRVTMTMKGYYPSIPGFHTDWVPRGKDGQPDLTQIDDNVIHYMCLLSDVESHTCTEFVIDEPELEFDYSSDDAIWTQLDKQINAGNYRTRFLEPNTIISFDQNSIHRASPTVTPGWRFFFRASLLKKKPANEIRNQVQIYAPIGMGW